MNTKNEMLYCLTMKNIKKMFAEGIITEEEYQKLDEKFTKKYKPKLSKLSADIDLI